MTAVIISAYYGILTVLALYGIHRLVLLAVLVRTRAAEARPPQQEWPLVTVQLPVYNEIYVAPRLLAATAALDYPLNLLEIQVVDDSDDETSVRLSRDIADLKQLGFNVHHVTRAERKGFKAGALAQALKTASGEFVAIFDADFVPAPDFLRKTIPAFRDPEVGLVQTCWGHLNRGFSMLTRAQAVLLDGHFLIEHDARARSGRFFNFNGTAGVWRRETITSSGGWEHDTLTEDLDLSYRAQLAGWKFVFLPQVKAPAELPVSMGAFKSQQNRWTKGSVQTLRKVGGRVVKARFPIRTKLEALVHLTSNFCYVLLVALAALFFPAMRLREQAGHSAPFDLLLLLASTGAVSLFYLVSQVRAGQSPWRSLLLLPAVLALGTGVSLHNAVAALAGWFQRGGVFERTPKYRVEGSDGAAHWKTKRYQTALSRTWVFEVALSVYLAICLGAALALGMWLATPFLCLFLAGYAWVATAPLVEAMSRSRASINVTQQPVSQNVRAA